MGFLQSLGSMFGAQGIPGEFQREHTLFDAGKAKLVDVRTAAEFAAGHALGAVNIPLDQVPSRLKDFGPTQGTVVLYCRSGNRSAHAAMILRQAGYSDVIDAKTQSRWDQGR